MPAACEVCGREPGRGRDLCERDCASDTVNGYTGVVDCLEVGYEHQKARAEAAERERERLEALFQQTHSVHHSWVTRAEKLEKALQEIERETRPGGDMADQAVNRLAYDALTSETQS